MASMEFNRRLFNWVLWIFAGLCLLVILTSCSAFDPFGSLATAQPTAQPTSSQAAAVTVVTGTATPRPIYQVAADALEVRTGPSEARPHVGYLTRGYHVYVFATAQAGQEYCTTWARIDPSAARWVCFKYLK